jgi:tetratricopeptide (TPR) repeat protein
MSWDEHISHGISAVQLSDYAAAEQSFKHALQIAKHDFSRSDERLALTLSLLGHTYFRNEDFRRAELLLEQSLRLHVQAEDLNEPCVLMDTFSLGEIKASSGQRLEACRIYDQIIMRLKMAASSGFPVVEGAADRFETQLSSYYQQLTEEERNQFLEPAPVETTDEGGDDDSAEEEHLQAQLDEAVQEQLCEEVEEQGTEYGGTPPQDARLVPGNTLTASGTHTIEGLWDTQLKKGLATLTLDDDEKEAWVSGYLNLESALRLANRMFEPADPRRITNMKALADASARLKLYEQAEALYRDAIANAKSAVDPDPTQVTVLRLYLGLFYAEFDQLKQAKKILENTKMPENMSQVSDGEALARRVEKVNRLIGVHDTVQNLMRQAQTLEEQGDVDKAAKLTNTALNAMKQGFAANHPEVARVLRYRSQLLKALGQDAQADETAQRAERIEKANEAMFAAWTKITEDLPKPDSQGVTV